MDFIALQTLAKLHRFNLSNHL